MHKTLLAIGMEKSATRERSCELVFHVTSQNGKYQSTMDSPDQGATGIPMDETTFENGKLKLVSNALTRGTLRNWKRRKRYIEGFL